MTHSVPRARVTTHIPPSFPPRPRHVKCTATPRAPDHLPNITSIPRGACVPRCRPAHEPRATRHCLRLRLPLHVPCGRQGPLLILVPACLLALLTLLALIALPVRTRSVRSRVRYGGPVPRGSRAVSADASACGFRRGLMWREVRGALLSWVMACERGSRGGCGGGG